MAKQVVNNADSGLVARTKINENFTELYDEVVSPVWYDDAGTIKPTGGAPVEVEDLKAGDLEVDGEARFGGVADYSQFDSDGWQTMIGNARVFENINVPIQPRNSTTPPTLTTFLGNLEEYCFAVDDYSSQPAMLLKHGWEEGTEFEVVINWATDRGVAANNWAVRWQLEYSIANVGDVFPATTTAEVQTDIPNPTTSYTHFRSVLAAITPASGLIGSQLSLRVKRIAVTGGKVEFTGDPFGLSIGVVYQKNSIGSRERTVK